MFITITILYHQKNEYIKYDYGIIEENIINENWSSVFSNIPYD